MVMSKLRAQANTRSVSISFQQVEGLNVLPGYHMLSFLIVSMYGIIMFVVCERMGWVGCIHV